MVQMITDILVICSIFRALIRVIKCRKNKKIHFNFMVDFYL